MDPFEMTVAADADLPALVLSTPTGEDIDRIAEICRETDIQEWTLVPRAVLRQADRGQRLERGPRAHLGGA